MKSVFYNYEFKFFIKGFLPVQRGKFFFALERKSWVQFRRPEILQLSENRVLSGQEKKKTQAGGS